MNRESSELLSTEPALFSPKDALDDYLLAYRSREASLLGRREVLSGKAKFGIFGDGKEIPQIAMARYFMQGDWRSGYYRDQTFAFAKGIATVKQFFAQLYAHADVKADPHSAGRQMNAHFATRLLDEEGHWKDQTQLYNTSSDASPTASQMPRLVGLAQASKLFRENFDLADFTSFSHQGNEVIFGTIGNASCAEGHFWEALNAVGVIQAPAVISIWDDDYGISVPNEFQITKKSLSDMLAGFQRTDEDRGIELFTVRGWHYEELLKTYEEAVSLARTEHIPCVIHVTELTQPQGHSTSGSHERYKTPERLAWERAHDCNLKMREYVLGLGIVSEEELKKLEKEEKKFVQQSKREAFEELQLPIREARQSLIRMGTEIARDSVSQKEIIEDLQKLQKETFLTMGQISETTHHILRLTHKESNAARQQLAEWARAYHQAGDARYDSYLYSQSNLSPVDVKEIKPEYADTPEMISGFSLLNRGFDHMFESNPLVLAFGEDVGNLGDVNQGFAGLQEKFSKNRIMDTGIRELTIMGQAIGLALRGLRPIAEIQYLDYLMYGLEPLSDDLATLHYRTHGGQKAPAIIRTRGHRLEGIWHSGSPLGMLVHALRGMHIAVPRDMTRAIGFYHTFMKGDDPALIIEVLNAYRLKEAVPDNLHEICIPPGVPEVLREGTDLTLVTYGACCRLAMKAAEQLADFDISVEVIDVQTLLPFDIHAAILESLKKTNRILFVDEDVPGGGTAYMMQEVLEKQGGYRYLDSPPTTLTAKDHRPSFGDDGDYWSKPQVEDIFRVAYGMMQEVDPQTYSEFY